VFILGVMHWVRCLGKLHRRTYVISFTSKINRFLWGLIYKTEKPQYEPKAATVESDD